MHAIEFKTKINNGIIKIPKEYRNKLKEKEKVKVIVLSEEEKGTTINMIDKLLNSPLHVKNFKPLTREELHERN